MPFLFDLVESLTCRRAETLGTPIIIIIGLQNQNELYLLQGAAATAALAFLAEGGLLIAARGRRRR